MTDVRGGADLLGLLVFCGLVVLSATIMAALVGVVWWLT